MSNVTIRMDMDGDGQRDVVVNGNTIGHAEKFRICGVTEWRLYTNDGQKIHAENLREVREIAVELYGNVEMDMGEMKDVLTDNDDRPEDPYDANDVSL